MNNYTVLHLHTMKSNATTVMDSVTSYKEYIDKASNLGMKSLAFTEHGNILGHVSKKKYCEEKGIKYIHGVESYLYFKNDYKNDYHIVLLAKNYKGFLEINSLHNHINAYNRDDGGQFYRRPRITFKQLKNTSDNIIITTACLGGVLYPFEHENELLRQNQDVFINFLNNNNNRCFLEIQHHTSKDQIRYNEYLVELSDKINVELVAGTDTHALNKEHSDGRKIMQLSKNIHFDDEEEWDLVFKSYDKLIQSYKNQNSLHEEIYTKAIENTNKISNMIESWDFDVSKKYPKLYDNSQEVLNKRIKEGLEFRGHELTDERSERIKTEIDGFKSQKAIDFLLLEDWVKLEARNAGVKYGLGRGSIGGSYLAYLLQITDIDPLKYNLIFERFMNPERKSEPDIDTDYFKEDIPTVKNILYSNNKFKCADIITYNTIQLKGAIRDVGRAFQMPLEEVDTISKSIEKDEDNLRKKYPKLFKYVDLLTGTIISIGSHPAALVVTDRNIYSELGTLTTSTSEYPIVQLDMKEVEYLKYIKLDLLKLNNIGVINKTYELLDKPRINAEDLDLNDDKVFDDMIKNGTTGVFQLESDVAYKYFKDLCNVEFIDKLQSYTGSENVTRFDMSVVASSIIRPVGDSYRDKFANGVFADYGNKDLNNLLKETGGYLLWQEQIIFWLNQFCDYSLGKADIIRRGFAKKTGTEQFIPEIKKGFHDHMQRVYGYNDERIEELVDSFIESILDASLYLFNRIHNYEYGLISYHTAYLRHYHPLEFLTASLRVYRNNELKVNRYVKYAKTRGISIKPITFGKSKGEYFMDKEQNSIYQGIGQIKYLNTQVGDELFQLSKNNYNPFTSLLSDISETSANSRQMEILIKLDYFRDFGQAKTLLKLFNLYNDWAEKSQFNKDRNKDDILKFIKLGISLKDIKENSDETDKLYRNINFVNLISIIEQNISHEDFTIAEKIEFQQEYLGYVNFTSSDYADNIAICLGVDTKYSPKIDLMSLGNGNKFQVKVKKKAYKSDPINQYDIVEIDDVKKEYGWIKVDDEWKRNPDRIDWWMNRYQIIEGND